MTLDPARLEASRAARARRAMPEMNGPERLAYAALTNRRRVTLAWGRGVGKSFFQRLVWYLLVRLWDGRKLPGAKYPGVRIVLLMPTLVQAKKVHLALLLAELAGDWKALGGVLNKTDWRVNFPGGSWIQWITAETAEENRGMRCDLITIDEADDIDKEVLDSVVRPWFSEPFSLGMTMISGTPRRGRYGLLYRSYKGLDNKGGRLPNADGFHATYRDVPEHVSTEYVESLRLEMPEEVFKREWECDFDAAEGLVYGMFSEATHVREPHPAAQWTEILIGGDHGYEDPGVLLVAGVAGGGKDATIHLLEEVYEPHKTETWWVGEGGRLAAAYPGARFYLDPSQPARVKAFRDAGCHTMHTDNAIEDGVFAVADRIGVRWRERGGEAEGYSRLYVSPACRNTIREFGLYRRKRDPRNKERVLDDIADKDNHAMDALRYMVFSRFGRTASTARAPSPVLTDFESGVVSAGPARSAPIATPGARPRGSVKVTPFGGGGDW